MLIKNKNGFYTSFLFSDIPGLVHAFSSRVQGDVRKKDVVRHMTSNLLIDSLVWQKQTHSDKVTVVNQSNCGSFIEADGTATNSSGIFLSVHVGDCVPILFVDPKNRIVAVAHAGWRGSLAGIATHAVDIMHSLGAKSEDIRAVLGPHIGMCCYDVPGERVQQFLNIYDRDPGVAGMIDGRWHLSLAKVNFLQLTRAGILPKNIDAHPICTSCRVSEFFSYRKDSKEAFGEIIGIIGFKN